MTIFSPISIFLSAFQVAGLIQRLGLSVPISYILIMSTKLYRLAG
jgi:hypothetical protein